MVVTAGIVNLKRRREQNITNGKVALDRRAMETNQLLLPGIPDDISLDRRAMKTNQLLLPGIPDDITVSTILPKLSWAMLQTFAVVSCGWLQALRVGRIFEARVSANSTKTMFVNCVQEKLREEKEDLRFSLYLVEDNCVYYVPRIPGFNASTLISFTYTSVNGRLYVFGCTKSETTCQIARGRESFTYEYDLARHRGWRNCASPPHDLEPTDCGVMHGKIFVCDGVKRSALYDPDTDVWFPMKRIFVPKFTFPIFSYEDGPHQKVLAGAGIPENLGYQYGDVCDSYKAIDWIKKKFTVYGPHRAPFFSLPCGSHIESVQQEVRSGGGIAVALLHGRFLKLTQQHVDAYDNETNTWTPLNYDDPFEFIDLDWTSAQRRAPTPWAIDVAAVRIKNEIYSIVDGWRGRTGKLKLLLMKNEIQVEGNESQEKSSSQQNVTLGQWRQLRCKLPLSCVFLRCPIQL